MERVRTWIRTARDGHVVRRSLVTAAVVGSILVLINHADDLVRGEIQPATLAQIALTLLVPYLVSTASSVAAIQRHRASGLREFPDQNPNPVLRMARDGRLLYANPASAPITSALGVAVGEDVPAELLAELRSAATAATASPSRLIEVKSGWQTFAVLPVMVPGFDFLNLYGTDITANKVVERFPDRNPNPVMRMSPEGTLLYANAASDPITSVLQLRLGEPLPPDLADRLRRSCEQAEPSAVEIQGDGRTYALKPVSIPEFGFINIYGTDVTATRAINKFPDQNPNPVLRVSREGRLLYGNPASALVRKAFGAEVGDELTADLCRRILEIAEAESPETLEVESDGHVYALLVVPVYEFGFINVYGTDITAAREVEKAHRENERLLLNILPASIAARLRGGEMVIADRFDEMTVLFADCVGFTELSSRLTAIEVVEMLNRVFSIFDELADRHGLEKIKTIGDAYMVVGGLAPHAADHAERMANMGLEMIAAVARLRAETGLDLEFRVGMHTGPAVAGVIGLKKFIYDVWGDTVNTASRMESQGLPGRVHVTESTHERLKDAFIFEPRGTIEIKGKGPLATYFLVERR